MVDKIYDNSCINRIFLFGNGATLACQNKEEDFRNTLLWGIKQTKKYLFIYGHPTISNIASYMNYNFEYLLRIFDQLTNGDNADFLDMHRDYALYINNKKELEDTSFYRYFNKYTINDITEYIFTRAYDETKGGFQDIVHKKLTLIGNLTDTIIDKLHNLQILITSLFCFLHDEKNIYDRFIQLLKKENSETKNVISLNWDNLFEQAFRRVFQRGTRLTEEPNHIFIPNQMAINMNKSLTAEKYNLLKPHGSIEYSCCQTEPHNRKGGCFRITVVPNDVILKGTSNPQRKCLFHMSLKSCDNSLNLKPFVQPYSRLEKSFRSFPFVQMALEASKSFLPNKYELIVIGYSFNRDDKGWIDFDLMPIFIRAHAIKIIGLGGNDSINIKNRMTQEFPNPNKITTTKFTGFEDYVAQSESADKLL